MPHGPGAGRERDLTPPPPFPLGRVRIVRPTLFANRKIRQEIGVIDALKQRSTPGRGPAALSRGRCRVSYS